MEGVWISNVLHFAGWAAVIIGLLGSAFSIVYKFGQQSKDITNHGAQIDEIHSIIEEFHGKCDLVNAKLGTAVTIGMLREHCRENQESCSIVKKVDALHYDVKELKEDQKDIFKELRVIAKAIGNLEGRQSISKDTQL